jgi:hypothetical protein
MIILLLISGYSFLHFFFLQHEFKSILLVAVSETVVKFLWRRDRHTAKSLEHALSGNELATAINEHCGCRLSFVSFATHTIAILLPQQRVGNFNKLSATVAYLPSAVLDSNFGWLILQLFYDAFWTTYIT